MTNAEKFKQIFGLGADTDSCPLLACYCNKHGGCITCEYARFWEKEYKLNKENSMYVERTFDSIKEAGDFIVERNISKDDIVEITLHTSDNGVTITFTTEVENNE